MFQDKQTVPVGQPVRLHYLDSLRVLAVFMVFVFHAAKPFTAGDWHVMNAQTSTVASVFFMAFLAPWGMPFFFLLAGAGTWFALRKRTARQFAGERFRRLLVPFLVGSVLLTPLQAYFEWKFRDPGRRLRRAPTCSSLIVERWGGWNPSLIDWVGYHLWFLGDLFAFSLIALPLLQWLKGASGRGVISRLAALCEHRGGILLFILPLLVAQLGLRPFSPNDHSWADFCYYLVFFLSGYLFCADERFVRAIRRDRWLVLAIGIAALLGMVAIFALGEAETWFWEPSEPGLLPDLGGGPHRCLVLVALYVVRRHALPGFQQQVAAYGQEAIVPFYVLPPAGDHRHRLLRRAVAGRRHRQDAGRHRGLVSW